VEKNSTSNLPAAGRLSVDPYMSNWDFMFDGRLEVVGTLDDAQLAKVPGKRGVVLLAGGDNPIQLITAANIRQRVKTRLDEPQDDRLKKSADLRRIITSVSWKLSGGPFEADLCLLEIARALWPDNTPPRSTGNRPGSCTSIQPRSTRVSIGRENSPGGPFDRSGRSSREPTQRASSPHCATRSTSAETTATLRKRRTHRDARTAR